MSALAQRVLAVVQSLPTWVHLTAALALAAFYAVRVWTVYLDTGLFRRLGFDWGLFYSQAAALAAGDIGAMYDIQRLSPYLQRLATYTRTPDVLLLQWPAPYPPLLAGLVAPLTELPPPLAFGIWTALGLACAGHLIWRINQLLPGTGVVRIALLLLTALPVLQVFLLGQPVLLLASALAESVLCLRRGADLRGGLWLGVLALKPQYALLLGLFLLWKGRWRAVAGALGMALAVVVGSALVAGPGAVLEYQRAVSAMSDFRDPFAVPAEMVNFRALIVNLRPAIGNTSGVLLFAGLAAATVGMLALATRKAWRRESALLDLQLASVLVATVLVTYHSHMHGMALLALPLALAWRAAASDFPEVKLAVLGLVLLPNLAFVWVALVLRGGAIDYEQPLWVVWPLLTIGLLLVLLGALVRVLWEVRLSRAREHAPAEVVLTVAPGA